MLRQLIQTQVNCSCVLSFVARLCLSTELLVVFRNAGRMREYVGVSFFPV